MEGAWTAENVIREAVDDDFSSPNANHELGGGHSCSGLGDHEVVGGHSWSVLGNHEVVGGHSLSGSGNPEVVVTPGGALEWKVRERRYGARA